MQEKETNKVSLSIEAVRENIYIIRGQKVMLDKDLAMLYGVQTKVLNQSVKRNLDRFPVDFMFQLSKEEVEMCSRSQFVTLNSGKSSSNLKSQIVTSSWGGGRKGSLAFTEQGIAMLSSVLNSKRAIQINIQIIRVFTKLREMIEAYKDLKEKVEEMEVNNEVNFREIFRAIRLLTVEKKKPKNPIGFVVRE
ncbi:MAG: ORF6N domain-containing protein [bacterium]